ncbi:ABC transporter substrate-binding protein [Deinococcus sp.]|uniref:ABC transporter substrate-binding protein n=1 Tax=Deinococcus sp. TaxID=47478 RepID=UPI003CC6C9ED
MLAAALTLSSSLAKPLVAPANQTVGSPTNADLGGTLRLTQAKDFDTYNPLVSQGRPNIPELVGFSGSLLGTDPYTYEYTPNMAETYSISADKRTYTINLRPELKWSDGQAITADDFITAFEIISKDEDANLNSYFFDNDKPVTWKKTGNLSFTITFPRATVQNTETVSYFFPLPDHIFGDMYRKAGGGAAGVKAVRAIWDLNTDPSKIVVPGEFKIASYKRGERLNLVKNPYYGEWNKDAQGRALPYIDGLQYNIVPDANAQLAQFLAGNVDVYQPDNRDKLAQIVAARDSGKLKINVLPNAGPNASVDYLYFNWNKSSDPFKQALFRNVKFRQAMSMLVNKDAMIDQVLGGLGVAAYTSVYPLYSDWVAPNVDKYKFNPTSANKLLDELGFKKRGADGIRMDGKGNKLSFTLLTNSENNRRQQLSRLFADEAKKAGVDVKTQFIPFNQLLDTIAPKDGASLTDRKFDAAISGLGGGGFINPVGVDSVLTCGGRLNPYNFSPKCIAPWETQQANLFFKSTAEFDQAKRKALANQIQQLQATNLGTIYLLSQNAHYAWDSRVQGEFPKKISTPLWASSYFGPRNLDLTWIKK